MNFKSKSKRFHGSSWQRLYSRQSVMCAMDRFVEAVDNMNETILVPARLMDMSCEDEQCNDMGCDNYYHCYTLLNTIKNELLWGGDSHAAVRPSSNRRRLSITSSVSLSDSDSDSVISESSTASSSSSSMSSTSLSTPETVVRSLRHHLFGLSDALNRLANSAVVLTCKYQEDIDDHGQC